MNILLVEDDSDSCEILRDFLDEMGHSVVTCSNGIEALECFINGKFQLVLSDIKMPKMDGIELLRRLRYLYGRGGFEVVIFTGHGELDSAIQALRVGAFDYLLKPIDINDLSRIIDRVEKIYGNGSTSNLVNLNEQFVFRNEQIPCESGLARIDGVGEIGIFSDQMRQVIVKALKFHEDRSIPVLIQGETGTGKEVVARFIHHGATVDNNPLVDINCAALTPSLFESELFGYEAGAFTGGLTKGSRGKLDLAQGGTLFLDEIGEMSLEVQAKLLRIIQEKEYFRVGGLKKNKADVRIICATNVDLKKALSTGRFRHDLYYRLNVGQITIPPLRERREEIKSLAEMFLKKFTAQFGKRFKRIDDAALKLLLEHPWPGNIRELKNIIHSAVISNDDVEVKKAHLAMLSEVDSDNFSVLAKEIFSDNCLAFPEGLPLDAYINEIVNRALDVNSGNKAKTARYLGISRKTLYGLIERLSKEFATV